MTRASSPYRHLLGLAPDEACHATYCYQRPGGLLHRRFTLTRRGRAVCSLLRYLSGHPGRTLSASCSMEPGSSSADPNEDHGRGHQEVSSLQLYIRCGKGGIPPYGEAMTLPGYPVFSMVGHSWTIRERRAEYRMGRVGRVVACRMETNQICKSLVCARKSKKTLPIHCSIYHDEQTSQPDKPVSNLLIGDCCQSPSIYIVSLQRKARE